MTDSRAKHVDKPRTASEAAPVTSSVTKEPATRPSVKEPVAAPPARPAPAAKEPDTEIWRNDTTLTQYMMFKDARGDVAARRIYPGEQVEITAAGREFHTAGVRGEHNDVFKSGALTPVRVGSGVKLPSNALTPDDLDTLFTLSIEEFEERIAKITSSAAIKRVHNEALERDVPMSRMGVITGRSNQIAADALAGTGIEVGNDGRRKLDLQDEDYTPPSGGQRQRPSATK